MKLAGAAVLLAAVLGGCASLSGRECRGGDWQGIGLHDGLNGETAELWRLHRRACGSHGITPDAETYRLGYAAGLEQYCTAVGGYTAGRRGDDYRGVCTGEPESLFKPAYRQGREVAVRVRELREQQRYIGELQSLTAGPDAGAAEHGRRQLQDAERHYEELQAQVERFDRAFSERYGVPVDEAQFSDY